MHRPRREHFLQLQIELVDFARLDLLQRPRPERRHDMTAQELGIAFKRATIDEAALASRAFLGLPFQQGNPAVAPLRQRDLVGCHVLAGVARADQPAQFLPGLRCRAAKGLAEPLSIHAIAQPPSVLATRINAAVAACASFGHDLPPWFLSIFRKSDETGPSPCLDRLSFVFRSSTSRRSSLASGRL
jgi:hypothetical protein